MNVGARCNVDADDHINKMERKHPHSGASYTIVQQKDMSFGVEVRIPETHPTTVTSFATEADAERWIASHKEGVAKGTSLRRRFFYPTKR
jgi:hypothetical protein